MEDWKNTNWYKYMDEPMRSLASQSYELLEQTGEIKDYSFAIFPIAKAYEGFLKKLFLDMQLISRRQYIGEHFRIGKALNPNLPKRYRSGWVWDKLREKCGGEELPIQLWEAWRRGRNKIFHYFPDEKTHIDQAEAREIVNNLAEAMGNAVAGCGIDKT